MAILQPLHDIAAICSKKDISDVVLCPGSRSAALTISFVRHPELRTYSISDERSAAFIGMGMAQQSQKTVVLVCTSGSAGYNFAPAITEAFFQEIPLLVLTADRPPEWIHQYDGQTIYQRDMYGKNVKKSFELPADYTHPDAVWQVERIVNEAINLSQAEPKGPVHINVPIREPFYPGEEEEIRFNPSPRIINHVGSEKTLNTDTWRELIELWNRSERKLIAVGQSLDELSPLLANFTEELSVPVVGDVISNIHRGEVSFIVMQDSFAGKAAIAGLEPHLLITTGKSFLSKAFKQFIRKNKPTYHWHIQDNPELIDPFQSVTHKIEASPLYFFRKLFEDLDFLKFREGDEEEDPDYLNLWQKADAFSKTALQAFIRDQLYGEFKLTALLLDELPEHSILHLGNSMPVRYVNLLGIDPKKNLRVYANRGTSGIDGILSTALGQALKTDKLVTCLIGDVSFFYDRNALWNNYIPDNLRIIMINNQGGNIFRNIDGPSAQPELDTYFVTEQRYTAAASAAGLHYQEIRTHEPGIFKTFFETSDKARLAEVFTDGKADAHIFQNFKTFIAEKMNHFRS